MTNMATMLANKIPCRYVVAKYVEDEVRDEPVNVGIIIQSQKDYKTICEFTSEFSNRRLRNIESVALLKGMVKNVEESISSSNDSKDVLDKIALKYTGKLRFTEPRSALAVDLQTVRENLFNRYIGTKQPVEEQTRVTHIDIRKQVSHYIAKFIKNKNMVKMDYSVRGKTSESKYDIAIVDKIKMFLQAISFDEKIGLDRTKLFDWSVRDTILAGQELTKRNFAAIISRPTLNSHEHEKMKEQYETAMRILSTYEYPLVVYDKNERWKKNIEELVKA